MDTNTNTNSRSFNIVIYIVIIIGILIALSLFSIIFFKFGVKIESKNLKNIDIYERYKVASINEKLYIEKTDETIPNNETISPMEMFNESLSNRITTPNNVKLSNSVTTSQVEMFNVTMSNNKTYINESIIDATPINSNDNVNNDIELLPPYNKENDAYNINIIEKAKFASQDDLLLNNNVLI